MSQLRKSIKNRANIEKFIHDYSEIEETLEIKIQGKDINSHLFRTKAGC